MPYSSFLKRLRRRRACFLTKRVPGGASSREHSAASSSADLASLAEGGLVRVGLCHYNTIDEVDRVLDAIERIATEGR